MQHSASEFSKIFQGWYPLDPHSGRGRSPPAPNTLPGPGVGTQTLVPLNFSAVVAPSAVGCIHFNDVASRLRLF